MTAGNNGTNTPEGEDPFGYLYRSEDGAPPDQAQQPGVPRTSYNQVRAVGERRYGQQTQQTQQPPAAAQDAQSPSAYYAAPEAQPGGRAAARQGHGGHGGRGGQPPRSRNGLLIGALAVVAAVVIGVGAAVIFSDDDSANADANQSASSGSQQGQEDEDTTDEDQAGKDDKVEDKDDSKDELPSEDASSLRLENGPVVASDIKGSKADDGNYVSGFNNEGAAVTWTTEASKAGKYLLYIGYTVPGKDMQMDLLVNDAQQTQNLNFGNFAKVDEGDWEKGWTYTYGKVNVQKGTNTFTISCGESDKCDVAMDRVWLAPPKG